MKEVSGMVIAWLAALIGKKLMGLRGISTRAIRGLLDDGQGAEISPDQWLDALLAAIAAGIAGEADDHEERQARPPTAAA